MLSFNSALYVFIGGGLGALLRWGFSLLSIVLNFGPWVGTLVANFLGCLLIFIFMKYFQKDFASYELFLKVGILGGLTTFSGFAYEVVNAFNQGRMQEGILILGLNIFLGIIIGFAILR